MNGQFAARRRRRKVEQWRQCADEASMALSTGDRPAFHEGEQGRLHRLSQWAITGRRDAAILELHDWRREADCPADAIALLAGLLILSDQRDHAKALIEESIRPHHQVDALLLEQLTALTATQPQGAIEPLIRRLHRDFGHDPAAMRWLHMIAGPAVRRLSAVSDATINQLAGELLEQVAVIPSLVAAQRLSPDPQTIAMLRGAMRQMMRDIEEDRHRLTVCQALADLAMLADDGDDARRWAHRGLRIDPYAAPLAIILSRLQDDPAVGPPASAVLQGAVNAHPKYPDLRAALIRREAGEGRTEVARRRLQQWLQREPNQHLALRLQQELAA